MSKSQNEQLIDDANLIAKFLEEAAKIHQADDKNAKAKLAKVLNELAPQDKPNEIVEALKSDLDSYIDKTKKMRVSYETVDYKGRAAVSKSPAELGKEMDDNDVTKILNDTAKKVRDYAQKGDDSMKSKFYKLMGNICEKFGWEDLKQICEKREHNLKLSKIKETVKNSIVISDEAKDKITNTLTPKAAQGKEGHSR